MEIARHWRLRGQRYRLEGEICQNGHRIFPPRDICPSCAATAKTTYRFSGKGEVYSFTTIYNPEDAPEGFEDQAPYTVALVRLIEADAEGRRIEGPLVTAMLTDLDISLPKEQRIAIGQPVKMVTRRLSEDRGHDGDRGKGLIIYGPKFRPLLQPAP